MKGFETHHRFIDFLDETVVLFDHVIQIFNFEYFNKTDQSCQHQQNVNILQPARIIGGFTSYEVLKWALGIDDNRQNKAGQMAVTRVLKKFGYSNAHRQATKNADAKRCRYWTKADAVYDKKRQKK